MSNTMTIKPADGLQVRDPLTGEPLPEAGADKPRNGYWMRRLRDGDVQIVAPKAKTTKASKE